MGLMRKTDKVFVAGHRGLVGSAIVEALRAGGFDNLLLQDRRQLDLEDQNAVATFFKQQRPDVVFVAAAKVGGILANNTLRADFIYRNLMIQNNVIWNAHEHGTHRLVFLGSSCVYPRLAPQPMPENCLLGGPLESTNRPYALAKIAGLELVESLRRQHGRDYFSVMPTNLYGPRDNFDPQAAHVIPGLMSRFAEAIENNQPHFTIWGTGKPLREFLFAADCAEAIVYLASRVDAQRLQALPAFQAGWSHINIGSGEELSIAELAQLLAKTVGYKGAIGFDPQKPDGTPRKLLDSAMLRQLGWQPRTSLAEGLRLTWEFFKSQPAMR